MESIDECNLSNSLLQNNVDTGTDTNKGDEEDKDEKESFVYGVTRDVSATSFKAEKKSCSGNGNEDLNGSKDSFDITNTGSVADKGTKRPREDDSSDIPDYFSVTPRSKSDYKDDFGETHEVVNMIFKISCEMQDRIQSLHTNYKKIEEDMMIVKHKLMRINSKLDRYENLIQFHPRNPRLHSVQYNNDEL